jgi:hypothetical protein
LLKDLNGNSIVKNLDGSIAGDVSGIEALSAFSFVGGGASLGFSVGVEKDTGSQKSISFGFGADAGFSFSIGINAFGAGMKLMYIIFLRNVPQCFMHFLLQLEEARPLCIRTSLFCIFNFRFPKILTLVQYSKFLKFPPRFG